MIKKISSLVLLPFFSTLFILLVFEIFLTYENYYKSPELELITIENNDYQFTKQPGLKILKGGQSKESSTILIGDSFIQGLHCAFKQENITGHLQSLTSNTSNVINLGVNGTNTADYLDFITNINLKKGDRVLISLYDNDINVSKKNCSQILRQSKSFDLYVPKFCRDLMLDKVSQKDSDNLLKNINQKIKHFKVVQLAKEGLVNVPLVQSSFYRAEYINRWNNFNAEENKWLLSSIRVMNQIFINKDIAAHFFYYPNTNAISADNSRHTIWKDLIKRVRREHGIHIFDPYPYVVENAKEKNMTWSLTDKHPSCEAHLIVANYLNSEVLQEKKNLSK